MRTKGNMTIQQFWLDHDDFKVDEAAYLLLGKNPRQPEDVDEAAFAGKRDTVNRAIESGDLQVAVRGGQVKRTTAFEEVGWDYAMDTAICVEREPEPGEIAMRGTGHGSEAGRLYIFQVVSEGEERVLKSSLEAWMRARGYEIPGYGLGNAGRLEQLFDSEHPAYSERLAIGVDTWFHFRERAGKREKITNNAIAGHIAKVESRYQVSGRSISGTSAAAELATVIKPTRDIRAGG